MIRNFGVFSFFYGKGKSVIFLMFKEIDVVRMVLFVGRSGCVGCRVVLGVALFYL